MTANNEIGTIQPIAEIGEVCHKHGVWFHTDAVQAVGNIDINVKDMNIDMLSLSGHKLHAPKGVGALYVKQALTFLTLSTVEHRREISVQVPRTYLLSWLSALLSLMLLRISLQRTSV